ncbi:MAG: DUF3999 domain-containing protein [Thermodesulfobacteriota bacterium]
MKVLLVVLSLLFTSPAWAGEGNKPLMRADFAYGLELTVQGQGAIYGLPVPPQVYQYCSRADLGDLRVFNGRGVVPHLLRPQVSKKKTPDPVVLPFFPLLGKGGDAKLPPDLHISTDSKGTIIDIRQGQGGQPTTQVSSYVIDTTGLKKKADWLEFSWTGQGDHFSTSVKIEASNDLNSWRNLVAKASLAELRFAGHDLVRNRITMGTGDSKYLRLSWPAGKKGVVLTAIKAGYNKEDIAQARTVHYLGGKPEPMAKEGKVIYHYTSDGFFPVDQIYVRLPQHNSLAQVTVLSRASEDKPWRQRASLLSYQLTIDGVGLGSSVKHITPVTDRFWRLELEEVGTRAGGPMLELGWRPQQLVFVAQGQGPYTLAYGRAGLGPERSPVDRLLASIDPRQEKNLIKPAYASQQIILGGKGQLLPSPEIPWRRWLLWAILVAGVLVIGAMALQLFKEMQEE